MTSLYHNSFHYHDATIISVHTLLKPQAYQRSTYINTPPSQSSQYISTSYSPYLHHQPQLHTPTTLNQHQHNYLYHDPYFQPKPFPINTINTFSSLNANLSSFDHFSTITSTVTAPGLTYNNTTTIPSPNWGSQNLTHHQQQTITTTSVFQFSSPTITTSETKTAKTQKPVSDGEINSAIVPKNGLVLANPFVETKINEGAPHEIAINRSDFLNNSAPISEVMDEQQGFVAETMVDQDPLELVLNLKICSDLDPVSEVVDKQQVVIVKEFNEFLALQENPAKHRLITTTRPFPAKRVASNVVVTAPLPQHLFIFDSGGDERQVRSLTSMFGNGVCVFDHGGDECIFGSSALISINNHCTQSLPQLPWDREKLGVSKSLVSVKSFEWYLFTSVRSITPPVTVFDPGGDTFNLVTVVVTDSGGINRILSLLWLPWDRGKKSRKWMKIFLLLSTSSCLFFRDLIFANITGAARHVKEEDAVRVNWELKSLEFSIDLMGLSYLGLLHFHTGPSF